MKTAPGHSEHFDAIVIGSGMGGLTTASLLAQLGKKRVLVLERHFKLGGFTHSFRRKKYEWDVGVHYVGEMQPGSMTRRIMDLATDKAVEWQPMSDHFERFIFPEGSFEVPSDPHRYQQKLIERFPAETQNIKRYFRDLRKAQGWVARWFVSKQYGSPLADLITLGSKELVKMTTAEYLSRFEDPLLRAFLAAQWPDYGSPPSESAFGFHATVAADFLHGGFYPVGGSKELAENMARIVQRFGGKCLVNHSVSEILVEGNKACGVRVERKGETIAYTAPMIISNAGAITTFNKLVPEEHCIAEREQSRRLTRGTSALILFVGLNDDPREHGFDDANYWVYDRLDHDTHARKREGQEERIDGVFVSFGSLRNPGQTPHTAQVISFSDALQWSEFDQSEWMRRGDAYEQQKAKIAGDMLAFTERYLPGFGKLVDYHELSTPLTVKSFTGHSQGMIYGQACDANRLFRDQWKIKTSLKNLYLTGSDTGTPGVNGALMAGVMTAAKLLGPLGLPRIMARAYSS
jgi:all-trans-retinol 13,14-reductase